MKGCYVSSDMCMRARARALEKEVLIRRENRASRRRGVKQYDRSRFIVGFLEHSH